MKRNLTIASFMLLFTTISINLNAQEAKFKALFIYKFAEYVEWKDAGKTTTIGVVGESDVFNELSSFAAAKDNISVIKISGTNDATKCNIIFLPESASAKGKDFANAIGDKSILLVSDKKELTGKGSDIGFFTEGGKLRFLISEQDIRRKNMTPSGKLLALGKSI